MTYRYGGTIAQSPVGQPEDNPGGLTNHQMGTVFAQLIRRFNEAINENPGEHFTPRDVIHLLVSLVILLDDLLAVTKGIRRTVADCAAGTGGMVSIAREEIQARNPSAKVSLFGQELNPQTWAVCRSELLLLDPPWHSPPSPCWEPGMW